jgi:hypothetical protein
LTRLLKLASSAATAPSSGALDPRVEAAREFMAIETQLAGRSILGELGGEDGFAPGEHYPPGEVWDPVTHAQYFYHAHPEGQRPSGEVGHFHTFLGQGGMPTGVAPLVLPEMALAPLSRGTARDDPGTHRSRRDRGIFGHLIAISMDRTGRPISLFTTNRWVTGETWYRAEDTIRMLDLFAFEPERESLLDRWLGAMIRMLRPQIAALIRARDDTVMDWRRRRSRQRHVFDDHRLEVTSEATLDIAAELTALLGASR